MRIKRIIIRLGKYTRILTYFITWTNFIVFFQQELLHSPNKLSAENCRYISGDIYVEPWN